MRKCTEKTGSFIKYTTPFSERFRSAHICSVFVACKKKLVVLPLGDKKNGLAQFLANVSLLHLVSSQYFHLPINGMFYRTRKKCVKPYSSILYCRCTKDIKSSFSAKHQTQNMTLRMSIWWNGHLFCSKQNSTMHLIKPYLAHDSNVRVPVSVLEIHVRVVVSHQSFKSGRTPINWPFPRAASTDTFLRKVRPAFIPEQRGCEMKWWSISSKPWPWAAPACSHQQCHEDHKIRRRY